MKSDNTKFTDDTNYITNNINKSKKENENRDKNKITITLKIIIDRIIN